MLLTAPPRRRRAVRPMNNPTQAMCQQPKDRFSLRKPPIPRGSGVSPRSLRNGTQARRNLSDHGYFLSKPFPIRNHVAFLGRIGIWATCRLGSPGFEAAASTCAHATCVMLACREEDANKHSFPGAMHQGNRRPDRRRAIPPVDAEAVRSRGRPEPCCPSTAASDTRRRCARSS